MSLRDKLWIVVLGSLVAAQLLISASMQRGTALTIVSDLLQGTLLLLATAAFVPNIFRSEPGSRSRLFWILMSLGMLFWLSYQGMWNYFEVVLRREVPAIFAGDMVLFLHLVPMIAALALRPHLREGELSTRVGMLDFALLLIWWGFLYVYCVIPWQYVETSETNYSNNYNDVYLTEKLVLLVILGLLANTSAGRWRYLYGNLLAASALYASSSYVANWAIGRNIYYTGSLYDIPLILSIAWIALLGRFARCHSPTASDQQSQPLFTVWITRFAMFAVFSLPGLALFSQLDGASSAAVRTFRVVLSLIALIAMGGMVFWRQRLLGLELSRMLDRSRNSFKDLQNLQEQLIQSEKLASLGRLVGGAAHEINNPLTAMLGYSELLSTSELRPEQERVAVRIGEQVRRTRTLVSNLLSFASQSPVHWSAVDLNSLVQTALRLLQPQLEAQSVTTHFGLAPSLPPVNADSNQLLRVTVHLAGQVCHHSAQDKPATLRVQSRTHGDCIVLEFSTDGDKEVHNWIALGDQYHDLHPTLSLSACRRIVTEHGGRILSETSDEGTVAFRLELPVATRSTGHAASRDIPSFRASATATS